MTAKQKAAVWVSAALIVGMGVVGSIFIIRQQHPPSRPIHLTGVVLADDKDPQKQAPLAYATIMATTGTGDFRTKSDASGLFRLTIPNARKASPAITLNFQASNHEQRDLAVAEWRQIQIVRLTPLVRSKTVTAIRPIYSLTNVKVRYSEKASLTTNVGSVVKTFEAVNTGNIPCNLKAACSPDHKWKASIRAFTLEGQGGEFRNVRLSCIAGPCPFTQIESQGPIDNGRNFRVSVRNWSDTTTFLLEAEVAQTRIIEVVRESFPALFGSSMNFTLPATAQGPSIEADMNGPHTIVYPLGPDLILSWAVCTVKVTADQTKLFRCDLKPEYQFK